MPSSLPNNSASFSRLDPDQVSMDNESLQHRLQRLDLGIVWLDTENHVTGFNDIAWQLLAPAGEQTLGISRARLVGIDLLQLHPHPGCRKLIEDHPADVVRHDFNHDRF
jgi:hypothetical protein